MGEPYSPYGVSGRKTKKEDEEMSDEGSRRRRGKRKEKEERGEKATTEIISTVPVDRREMSGGAAQKSKTRVGNKKGLKTMQER